MFKSTFYNNFFIPIGKLLLKIFTIFSEKTSEREKNLNKSLESLDNLSKNKKVVWFHSSSMGEFEQAKPIIELLKSRIPELQIAVSFFSPSGYNNQKNYNFADAIFYLPFDSENNINNLLDKINPNILIIIRYEIWRNLIELTKSRNIPVYLVAATFPRSWFLTTLFSRFTKKNYKYFDKIFCVNQENFNLFKEFGINENIYISADTRYDRIISNIQKLQTENFLLKQHHFDNSKFTIVAGSTWKDDDELLIDFYKENKQNFNLVLVPHEPDEEVIERLKENIDDYVLYSEIEAIETNLINEKIKDKILIVDKIGILLKLYSVADVAYIGGAFGAGVHSVTEPAGYGIPVIAGEDIDNSPDAIALQECGSLFSIKNLEELTDILYRLKDDIDLYHSVSEINRDYIYKHKGESEKIYALIKKAIGL